MSLIYISCAWVAGIFLGSRLDPPLASIFIVLVPVPLLFLVRQHKKTIILASLCLVSLISAAYYSQSRLPAADQYSLQFYNDRGNVEIKGLVARDPEKGAKATRLYLSATEVKFNAGWYKVSGNTLIVVPRYPAYDYGDILLVKGELNTPPLLGNFDYKAYLAQQEIYATMQYPGIEVLGTGQGSKVLGWIYSLRSRLAQVMAEVLPEPQASLAQGIVLGMRGNIPPAVTADFVSTGTAHILAISGQNLSIIAGILVALGLWLFGRKGYLYLWLTIVIIWLYALLTALQPPVVRATIMASLFLTAELLGRQRSALTALAFAGAVMVGINPQILWNVSFQMSFMSMAGLILISPRLQPLGRRAVSNLLGEDGIAVSAANFITDSFSVTLGALIAIWPIIAYYFGIISLIAPLATLFALLVFPGIIIVGTLTGGLGLIVLPLAQVTGWLAWLFLSYMLLVVKFFTIIPSIEVGSVNTTLIWLYYSALVLAVWLYHNRQRVAGIASRAFNFIAGLPKKWAIPTLLVLAILAWVTAITMPDSKLHVTFLNVGQGDAILIQRSSQQILIDGGSSPQTLNQELGRKMPFWDRTIEMVILTHPHADHVTGLVDVLGRYRVNQVLYPDLPYSSPLYAQWLSLIRERSSDGSPQSAPTISRWHRF